mmetsp:Transcript_32967/g.80504  ORF Transcript_32967/g.80504 Transcript_32967/m.80504 type:complete len:197 (-) Transcript_32967:78-668(-)
MLGRIFGAGARRAAARAPLRAAAAPARLAAETPFRYTSRMHFAARPAAAAAQAVVARNPITKSPTVIPATLPVAPSTNFVKFNFLFTVTHYQDVAAGLARNLFQTFRPLLILMLGSQLFKMASYGFLSHWAGQAMMAWFYTIFFFEMLYLMLQGFISFVFICVVFHNNAYFRGLYRGRLLPLVRRHASKARTLFRL